MKFLDEAKIYLKSGDGGAGCVSFRREKFIEYGGPNGGDGGRGGDIIFESVPNLNTLIDFRYQQHFKAAKGHHGMGSNRSGPAGNDMVIKIPVGTQIFADDKETLLVDFTEPHQRLILLRGGRGGVGNAHFKSSTNQAPRYAHPGTAGEEMWVWLRLKLIADVGLLGLPNVGKSTFLSVVSRARPKIADYPFTTLVPCLGVAHYGDQEFVIADIPGLIEGAHEGVGLGTRFLGHIERCSVLIHLIDATHEAIDEDYLMIQEELQAYSQDLVHKQQIIALNKCDALTQDQIQSKVDFLAELTDSPVFAISAHAGLGVQELLRYTLLKIQEKKQNPTQSDIGVSAQHPWTPMDAEL